MRHPKHGLDRISVALAHAIAAGELLWRPEGSREPRPGVEPREPVPPRPPLAPWRGAGGLSCGPSGRRSCELAARPPGSTRGWAPGGPSSRQKSSLLVCATHL